MANLYPRNNVLWYRFTYQKKCYRGSTGTNNRNKANKVLNDRIAEIRGSGSPNDLFDRLIEQLDLLPEKDSKHLRAKYINILRESGAKKVTFKEAWEIFKATPKKKEQSEHTEGDYKSCWFKLADWCKEKHKIEYIHEIDEAIALQYLSHLWGTHISPRRFNQYIIAFRYIYKLLKTPTGITENPWLAMDKKEQDTISKKPLGIKEIKAVFAKAEDELKILLAIGGYTALRLGDCCLMKWASIEFDKMQIRLEPSKTSRRRKEVIIPMHPFLENLLKALLGDNYEEILPNMADEYILPNISSDYLKNASEVTDDVQELFIKCGIKTQVKRKKEGRAQAVYGFHSLRHSFVTILAENNVAESVAMKLVGHSSIAVHRIYQHVRSEHKENAIAQLPTLDSEDNE